MNGTVTIQRTNAQGITSTVFTTQLNTGSVVHRELMSEHYVQLNFETAEPVYFKVGDFCVLDGFGRFELVDPYSPTFNTKSGGYSYELRLDAYYWKWKNKKCKYVPESAVTETSFSLTAAISVHIQVALRCINQLGIVQASYKYNGTTNYTYALTNYDADDVNAAKLITYDSLNMIDALTTIAETFECEWWVTDNCIHFGRCETNAAAVDFTFGSNVCAMSSAQSKQEYATRIYAFGSERNLPTNYRADNSADITVNGVIQKRLMLPLLNNSGQPLCPNGYVQAANVENEEQAIEKVITFDDIYPRVECIVDVVTTYEKLVYDEDGQDTGETQTFYRVTDSSGFNFNTQMILEGETLHIQFTSGRCNGMDFECQYNDTQHYYEIVANEDYGRFLPDSLICPAHGDTFVLYGWDATQMESTGIIQDAEMELYERTCKWLQRTQIDPNTYTCTLFSDWVAENDVTRTFELGRKVSLTNVGYFASARQSRIIGFELKLDYSYDSPEYIVGESAEYSRLADVESKVQQLTVNGVSYIGGGSGGTSVYVIAVGDSTPASDSNVFSARRSLAQFLRKDIADTARGRITFEQQSQHNNGLQIGQAFVPGLIGVGGRIDGSAHAELRSLTLWEWLEVPELRYNKVTIYIGIRWDTFGGGIIETITPDENGAETGSGTLKLDDGEIGAIAVGDLCMGIWHDESGNANANSDDNIGNFTFAGFKTVYFQITGVSGAHNENFTYLLRGQAEGGNGFHPFVGMHFAGRGNISNTERQAFTYTTTEYSVSLTGVNTWEFQPSNYYEIHGHLEGFSMPAVNSAGQPYTKVFHGYGQVFGNAYIFGQLDQFERIAFRCFIEQSLGGTLAPNETEDVAVSILNGYGEDVAAQFTHYSVTRNSGDAASDAVWNASHTNVGNPFQISFSDLGIDGIHRLVTVFTVTATDEVMNDTAQATAEYFS